MWNTVPVMLRIAGTDGGFAAPPELVPVLCRFYTQVRRFAGWDEQVFQVVETAGPERLDLGLEPDFREVNYYGLIPCFDGRRLAYELRYVPRRERSAQHYERCAAYVLGLTGDEHMAQSRLARKITVLAGDP